MATAEDKSIIIMAIVNLTDDSFYPGSRCLAEGGTFDVEGFRLRVRNMVKEGAGILDLGACSARPGSRSVSEEEEWERLRPGLLAVAEECPGVRVSIDTFRPAIVSRAYDLIGPFIVNDVSGGCADMWSTVGELGLEYVAMHTRGTPETMQQLTEYDDVTLEVIRFFDTIAETADRYGVKDWILDPGFGFAKTVEQNWAMLREMDRFGKFGKRILAGLSRKSFLYKPLGITPDDALTATQIADFIALDKGADILRVHDVAEASRTIRLFSLYRYSSGGSPSQKPV